MMSESGLAMGTITSINPLRLQADGAATSTTVRINATGGTPKVNDRVCYALVGARLRSKRLAIFCDPRPIGEYMMMMTGTAPSPSWVLCDGSSVLRASYPALSALWAIQSYPFGTVDSTHFTLPDFRGKFPMATASPGTSGGANGHSHTLSDSGRADISVNSAQIRVRQLSDTYTYTFTMNYASAGTTNSTPGTTTIGSAALSGATDTNADTRPPFIGVAIYVKAL